LLLCVALFQASSPTPQKPIIENDRVAVWEVTSTDAPQPTDALIVWLAGGATFVPKGTAPEVDRKKTGVGSIEERSIKERSIVINLKDSPAPAYTNTTKYPLAFPRPGSKKILENDRVIVWDYAWTPDVATPMHFHDKDVVVVFLDDGDLKSTTADGKDTVNEYKPGTTRFNLGGRTHTETLIRGKQRAIITELK
jgi:hypothetical protein